MDFIKFLFNKAIFVILAFAGAYGLVKGEEFFFYEKVEAEAVEIVPLCRFKKDDPDAKVTRPESCEKARKRESAMSLKNYTLVENRKVYFNFVSPVDNQVQRGSLYFSLDSEELPEMGETRIYLASKKHKKRLKRFS